MASTSPTSSQFHRTEISLTHGKLRLSSNGCSRNRIHEEFKDGITECTVFLKDRSVEQDDDMKLWYSRAFGPLRNIMTISWSLRPGPKFITKTRFFIDLTYEMFPELEAEFGQNYMPRHQLIEMQEYNDEDIPNAKMWKAEIDMPYGNYSAKLMFYGSGSEEGGQEELIENTEMYDKYIAVYQEPKPISAAEQERRDNEEEEENKKKEQQARNKQKQLDEKKAEMRLEKQDAIRKQEQNSAALKVYFRAMNLQLHQKEEDFNASMSILSIYHLELHENFLYYAQPFQGPYNRVENELIPWQGFFNFCKVMKLATSATQVVNYFKNSLCEIEGINTPLDDTLNVKNGLNYA